MRLGQPDEVINHLGSAEKQAIMNAVFQIRGEDPLPGTPDLALYSELPETEKKTVPGEKCRIIGISGKPRSGKDVAGDYLVAHFKNVKKTTFSDNIIPEANQVLKHYGVANHEITADNKSEPIYRRLLQEIGFGYRTVDPDHWIKKTFAHVNHLKHEGAHLIVVTGLRPVDYLPVKEHGGEVCEVVRPGNQYRASHAIEDMPPNAEPDHVILNDVEGDLAPYEKKIARLIGA